MRARVPGIFLLALMAALGCVPYQSQARICAHTLDACGVGVSEKGCCASGCCREDGPDPGHDPSCCIVLEEDSPQQFAPAASLPGLEVAAVELPPTADPDVGLSRGVRVLEAASGPDPPPCSGRVLLAFIERQLL